MRCDRRHWCCVIDDLRHNFASIIRTFRISVLIKDSFVVSCKVCNIKGTNGVKPCSSKLQDLLHFHALTLPLSPIIEPKNEVVTSIYLSIYLSGLFNSCRRLPEPKRHSSLFLHCSGSRSLDVMAACTPSIHVFLGHPLFLLSGGIHSIISFGSLSSGILLTCPYHCSLFTKVLKRQTVVIDGPLVCLRTDHKGISP